jgi:uncharacterized protein
MYLKIYKKFHDRFISLQGNPESIAAGMAIGVFIGITPTIPFHTALIIMSCLIFKQNLSAAYLGSWLVSNPVTIPVLYLAQYELGSFIIGSSGETILTADYSLQSLMNMGAHVILPILLGGILTAPVFAIPAYFITRHIVYRIRKGTIHDHP